MEDLDEICVDYEQGRTWKTYALAAVAVIACVAMAFPSIYRAPYELIGEGRTIYSGYLALLPLILLSTIVGFDPAVIAAFMLLGARCFYLHSFSYDACLYLLAPACAWIVGRNRWFRHIPLSFIASLFYAVWNRQPELQKRGRPRTGAEERKGQHHRCVQLLRRERTYACFRLPRGI